MTSNDTMDRRHSPRQSGIPPAAHVLGWGGVLPFAALSASLWLVDDALETTVSQALVVYAAVILSFMGGVHWGVALSDTHSKMPTRQTFLLCVSVLPAIAAWGAALLPPQPAVLMIASAFLALYMFDRWAVGAGHVPDWYGSLRLQLTSAVILCLIVAATAG